MRNSWLALLLLLICPMLSRAGDLSLGLGYPYVGVKDDFGRYAAEARFATGFGIDLYGARAYWNFHKFDRVTLFTGVEAGYIHFNTFSVRGTGWETSAFLGGEVPITSLFSLSTDFSPMYVDVNSQSAGARGFEYVVNFAIYIYPFARASRPQSPANDEVPLLGR